MKRMVRSFLPVGQGAFYCESFRGRNKERNLNIVYDCGSKSNVKYVEREIRTNFRRDENIDALFISHLDEDHINGIPFLLKYCCVKKIYFPLITSHNLKIVNIDFRIRNVGGFSYDFIENPEQAIRNLDIDYRPDLIQIREFGQLEDTGGFDIGSLGSGGDVFNNIIDSDEGNADYKDLDWVYIPFNFRHDERLKKLQNELENRFGKGRIRSADALARMWSSGNDSVRNKIKEAYRAVPGSLNTNSMTLFSGTKRENIIQWMRCNCTCCRIGCGIKQSGCLYMGDYDASGSQKWKQLKSAYNEYWLCIGCVQVPHHGSQHNFNDELLKLNCYFVISAGTNNMYRHPHASVLKKFLFNYINPHIVTENVGSAVYFVVDF